MPATTVAPVPTIGTVIGHVPEGEVLAGWAQIATGDGRYIVTKSGACFGREHDRSISTDLAWDAVGAYFAQRQREAATEYGRLAARA